jgi:hypothetical protein
MCRAKNGNLLTNKNQVLAGWKEHFEEHLNEGSESEQPTRPVNLRDDGVETDLSSREKIEEALKYLKNNKAAGIKETQLLAYADDIDIVGKSQSAVRNAYLALEEEAAKDGLKINEQKTKYMIAARNCRMIRDVGQSVAIGDKHFEVCKEFVDLGSLMTPTNDVSLMEIQRRI